MESVMSDELKPASEKPRFSFTNRTQPIKSSKRLLEDAVSKEYALRKELDAAKNLPDNDLKRVLVDELEWAYDRARQEYIQRRQEHVKNCDDSDRARINSRIAQLRFERALIERGGRNE
jgi:hypothetical protein